MWTSTLNSYGVLWRCHRHLTPRYRQLISNVGTSKRAHHLRSPAQMTAFLDAVKKEYQRH